MFPAEVVGKIACTVQVDTELVYAYAKTGENGPLEEFISGQHQANLQSVGDRCFEEGLYEAARIVFQHIPNYGRLASTLVKLHLFQPAVDAARKANSPKTWKEARPSCPMPSSVYSSLSLSLQGCADLGGAACHGLPEIQGSCAVHQYLIPQS